MRAIAEYGLSDRRGAERTGYRDLFYFAKLFKKKMGCTPSEYWNDARPG
ncbi:AraC family transcriptional regulator [Paenibacillus cisolokensis]